MVVQFNMAEEKGLPMLILYSYPELFGLPDNNPFGLKVDTFLRLAKINYQLEHILDTKDAPRGQLPYILDDGEMITDSNRIIQHLTKKYKITFDSNLSPTQKNLQFLVTRLLDNHLYWVMSYSRWQDEQFWPLFKAEFLRQFPQLAENSLEKTRNYNIEKYHYQGIGRYKKEEIYQAGIDNLKSIDLMLAHNDFFFGSKFHTIDACCYGFLANILYFQIETPLKEFMVKESALGNYTNRIRALLGY
ncbi:TPA: glutathione S-transferase family protein [Legionella feeleii]